MFKKHRYYISNDNVRKVMELTKRQVYRLLTDGYSVALID